MHANSVEQSRCGSSLRWWRAAQIWHPVDSERSSSADAHAPAQNHHTALSLTISCNRFFCGVTLRVAFSRKCTSCLNANQYQQLSCLFSDWYNAARWQYNVHLIINATMCAHWVYINRKLYNTCLAAVWFVRTIRIINIQRLPMCMYFQVNKWTKTL